MKDKPDWRDPDMPVIRKLDGEPEAEEFSPEEVRVTHEYWFKTLEGPHYLDDPTYNLRKR